MFLIVLILTRLLVILALVFGINPIYIKKRTTIIVSSYNIKKTFSDRTLCGLQKKQTRILGGELTEIGEFPWLVALEYKYKNTNTPAGIKCGGSLINRRFVLTAAHCITHNQFNVANVRLGEWNITTDPDCQSELIGDCADPIHIIAIEKTFPHPYHIKSSGDNDIGLIRLERNVKWTNYIRPICLPTMDSPVPEFGTKLLVVGWGKINKYKRSDVPLKLKVPLLANKYCYKIKKREIDGNQLCAGGEYGKDASEGDSGGPLMRLHEDPVNGYQWYQEGLVANGKTTGKLPSIYVRVSRYLKWIKNIINKD